jgi:hypothetical protein
MTTIEALFTILDAGGKVVLDPDRPRLLAPRILRPLAEAHRDEFRALLLARGASGELEVLRRAKAFKQQIGEWAGSGHVVPLLTLPDAPEPKIGHCVSCGSQTDKAWRCSTCLAAIRVALDTTFANGSL